MIPESWIEWLIDQALSPGMWLSGLLVVIFSALFSLWRGGKWPQPVRDLISGAAGFAIAHLLARVIGLPDVALGEVQLLWGAIGTVAGLALGRWRWRVQAPAR